MNLLNEASDSKFVTRKWNIVNGQSNANYGVGIEITYNTKISKSNLCEYNNAYILVRGDIIVVAVHATQVAFKNCAPFTKCITKIDETKIDDAEDLDLVMPMYRLLEYYSNCSDAASTLWFCSKGEGTNFNNDIVNIDAFKSLKCKAKLLGNTVAQPNLNQANGILKDASIVVPLKYLSNFWRSREIPLINCKIELKLRWTKHCVLSVFVNENDNANNADSNNIIFTIKNTKLYIPVVILSAKDNQKLSRLPSKGFERLLYWSESKIKSENKNTTNEYKYFIESNFVGVNRLFVLIYPNQGDKVKRFNDKKYYSPKGIIKNYNAIVNRTNFYDNLLILI